MYQVISSVTVVAKHAVSCLDYNIIPGMYVPFAFCVRLCCSNNTVLLIAAMPPPVMTPVHVRYALGTDRKESPTLTVNRGITQGTR